MYVQVIEPLLESLGGGRSSQRRLAVAVSWWLVLLILVDGTAVWLVAMYARYNGQRSAYGDRVYIDGGWEHCLSDAGSWR